MANLGKEWRGGHTLQCYWLHWGFKKKWADFLTSLSKGAAMDFTSALLVFGVWPLWGSVISTSVSIQNIPTLLRELLLSESDGIVERTLYVEPAKKQRSKNRDSQKCSNEEWIYGRKSLSLVRKKKKKKV